MLNTNFLYFNHLQISTVMFLCEIIFSDQYLDEKACFKSCFNII